MNNMINTRDVIIALKKVKKERKLSNNDIYQIVKDKNFATHVSETTVNRVFRKDSENIAFRYEATLRPIANALLDMEEIEDTDTNDTQAYKSILVLKQEIITELEARVKAAEEKNHDADHYIRSIDHLMKQIDFKDKRIDQLLDANDRLQAIVDKLTEQLLSCPHRGKGCEL